MNDKTLSRQIAPTSPVTILLLQSEDFIKNACVKTLTEARLIKNRDFTAVVNIDVVPGLLYSNEPQLVVMGLLGGNIASTEKHIEMWRGINEQLVVVILTTHPVAGISGANRLIRRGGDWKPELPDAVHQFTVGELRHWIE